MRQRATSSPTVSVVIPTFQRRELVRRSVASALAQTVRDIEVIVMDDGSTDGTEEILSGLDERLRCFRQEHRGVAVARNLGIKHARAPVVAFLDSDILWLPDHLAVVTYALARYPDAVLAAVHTDARAVGRQGGTEPVLLDLLSPLLVGNPVGSPSTVAVRRQSLAAAGGFDEELQFGADLDLWLRLALVGPFSIVRGKTRLRQKRSDSLQASGLSQAAYLQERELMFARTILQLERSSGAHRQLLATARGMHSLCVALRYLREQRKDDAAAALVEARALMPALSVEYRVVFDHLRIATARTDDAAELSAGLADLWPEPAAPTAHVLRAWGALLALRAGRLRRASGLVADRELFRSGPRTIAAISRLAARALLRELRHRRDHAQIAARRWTS